MLHLDDREDGLLGGRKVLVLDGKATWKLELVIVLVLSGS